MFAYRGQSAPICLFDTFDQEQRRGFVTDYQAGPYHLDPFYKASYDEITPGVYGIRDLAPDHFFLSEYYLSYYRNMGLADEMGFFSVTRDGARIVVSLMRDSKGARYDQSEKNALQQVFPIVEAFVANLWEFGFSASHSSKNPAADDALNKRLESSFQNFGADELTRREQQISQLLLRGHSSASIANELTISLGTVKIHRKNIYAKLGISSHSDLFTRFLSSLTQPTETRTEIKTEA